MTLLDHLLQHNALTICERILPTNNKTVAEGDRGLGVGAISPCAAAGLPMAARPAAAMAPTLNDLMSAVSLLRRVGGPGPT